MVNVNYSIKELELVGRIKYFCAPSQILEYTKDRMSDLLEYGLFSNEEFQKMVREEFANPLDILDFDNDNANGGSLFYYTEATKNGYIKGFDTMAEVIEFCIAWLYVYDDLRFDFENYIKFEESKKNGEEFDVEELRNDYFSFIYK
jgi:hypothetical protein